MKRNAYYSAMNDEESDIFFLRISLRLFSLFTKRKSSINMVEIKRSRSSPPKKNLRN